MIRNAAKINLANNAEWGHPFATIATAKNGRLHIRHSLTPGAVSDWCEERRHFQVCPRADGAFVRYKPELLSAGSLATRVVTAFFDPEHYAMRAIRSQDEHTKDNILSLSFRLYTAAVRIGEEATMKNYRHISVTELAGSGLYALFSTIEQYGAENLLSFQCHHNQPQSFQQVQVPKIN